MLWKKESMKDDALYVNLLSSRTDYKATYNQLRSSEHNRKPIPQKSDAIALQKRIDGNELFRVAKSGLAMEMYNECLCFAKPGSENISLAYANRSSCFLQLKMYDECLKDIELAKEAGYPDNLMIKLDQRKERCLKEIQEDTHHVTVGAKLDFDPDDQFPCMANVLKVQKNVSGNYFVVAKEDIDVDKTVVVEIPFHEHLSKRFGLKCNICLKGYTNLIPCKKCASAMFCEGCQNHILHEYECGLNMCGPGALNSDILFEVRMILLAINAFPSVGALMNFVEDIIQRGAVRELPESLIDNQSKFQAFFTTMKIVPESDDEDSAWWTYAVYNTVLKIPKIKAMFQSEKHLRFLQHLIVHNSSIPTTSATFGSAKEQSVNEEYADPIQLSRRVSQMDRYFKHSCAPNVLTIAGDGREVYVTARPIKKGEELLTSKIPLSIDPTKVRQEYYMKRHYVKCECPRCNGATASRAQQEQMKDDPIYKSIIRERPPAMVIGTSLNSMPPMSAFIKLNRLVETNQVVEMNETIALCVNFLKKYGRSDWCDELKTVLAKYQEMLFFRVAGFQN